MKTLQVIIVLIGYMFSFNNQIFAIECDITKFTVAFSEVAKTGYKDELKLEELASYSVCGVPIKTSYESLKGSIKSLVDLEKYEKQSGSKVDEKAKSGGKTEDLAIECDINKLMNAYSDFADTKFKDEAKGKEFAAYSFCEKPTKTYYAQYAAGVKEVRKGMLGICDKYVVDLEKYEKKSGSKVAQKEKSEELPCGCGGGSGHSRYLEGATYKDVDLRSCKLARTIANSKFINVNLEGYDLSKIMMSENTFENSNLKNTNWSNASINASTFINTNFEGATNLTDGRTFILNKFINVNISDEFEDAVCGTDENQCSKAQLVADSSQKCEVLISKDSLRTVSQTVGKDGVDLIKFSNDGKLISISYGDGTTIVYESSSGKKLFNLAGKSSSQMQSIVFSKDNKYILAVNRNELFKWSSKDGSLILNETFFHQEKKSYVENKNFTLSPNGDLVAGIRHLDVDFNKKTEFAKKHNITLHEDAFVYDITKNKILFKFKCNGICNDFTFSKDSKLLAINTYKIINIYNVSTGKIVRQVDRKKFETTGFINYNFNNKGDEILVNYLIGHTQYFSRYSLRKNKIIKTKLISKIQGERTGKGIYGSEIKFTKDRLFFAVVSEYYDVQIWDYKNLEIVQSWKLEDNHEIHEMFIGHKTLTISNDNQLAFGLMKGVSQKNPGSNVKYWELNLEERPEKIIQKTKIFGPVWTFAEFKYKNDPKQIKDTKSLKIKSLKIIDDRYIVLEKEAEDKNITFDMFKRKLISSDEINDDYLINITDNKLSIEDGLFNVIFDINLKKIWDVSLDINKKYVTILTGNDKNSVKIFDLATKKIIHNINISPATSVYYNGNGELYFGAPSGFIFKYLIADSTVNCTKVKHSSNIVKINYINNSIYSSIDSNGLISLWNKNGIHLLDLYLYEDNQWISLAKNGRFDYSTNFSGFHFVKNKEVISVDQFFDDFYTPGLLSQVYQTGELDETRSLDDALKQVIPTIEIIEPKKTTTRGLQLAADDSSGCKVVSSQTRGFKKKKKKKKTEEPGCGEDGTLRVVTKVTDQGGGFQDIVLYHNGKRLESVEGEVKSGTAQKDKTQLVTFRVPLAPGENYLRAEAKSLSRVRARPWQMVVDFEAPKPKGKPDLYLYVVGINKYSNSKYNLNYGRPDAEAVHKALGDNLKLGAFEKVHVSGIYDLEATKKNIAAQFLKFSKQARPRDVFIFYYAGHGRTLKDENGNPMFYIVSSNVGALDQDKTVKKGGLSGLELINYSKKIRAGKQMFLFDACESGSVAKAFARIQKDTGGHILYAAASNQLATEFDSLGHGIFTYTLLKTLEDNKKLNVSLLSGGMDFLLEELRPEFNLTDQTFGYYRTLEAPNFAIKSM